MTVDQVVANISMHLHLSKETEHEVLAEIRSHLEDAIDAAISRGGDAQEALLEAAGQFGIAETGAELQEVHATRDSLDALVVTALPVLCAVVLRWLAFAPDGSPLGWAQLLVQPGFYLAAAAALLVPLLCFRRWKLALAGWGIFWLLSVIFVVFPTLNHW